MALNVIPAGQQAADCKPRLSHLRQTEMERERHEAGYFSPTLLNWMSKQALCRGDQLSLHYLPFNMICWAFMCVSHTFNGSEMDGTKESL